MKLLLDCLFVGLVLGLAWALRGHFGHEHGAAWAGGLSGLAILAVSTVESWKRRWPTLSSLSALGWGIGGTMSYGLIVGYGRSSDFSNVYYGLTMLLVVGGLYGFLGGGLFGLGLESTNDKRPDWPRLVTEMLAGACLVWGVVVAQFGWHMTPPRSELWAACLGAACSLTWYLYRNGFPRAIRVACYSGLGGGFGFALGNFFQTLGTASGVSLNWWNLMEFTLGFCGGVGMAYGVFSTKWAEGSPPSATANRIGWMFLIAIIPAINIIQAFESERILREADRFGIASGAGFVPFQQTCAWFLLIITFGVCLIIGRMGYAGRIRPQSVLLLSLACFLATYIFLSHIKKAFFWTGLGPQPEQVIYWVLFCLSGAVYLGRNRLTFSSRLNLKPSSGYIPLIFLVVMLVLLAGLAAISIQVHDGLPGAQNRF